MKISVVIPIYNGERYIEQTIISILKQPYKDFEILCIDDGSIDSSSVIVKRIANQDSRVKYFYKENGGVHTARNKGIELCSGEFVAFLDQDDLWAKNSITDDFIDKLLKDKCDFYKCSYFEVDQALQNGRLYELPNGFISDIRRSSLQHHSSYIFNSKFIKSNNIFTDEYRCEDWRFLMRCYAYAHKAETLNNPYFLYRNNSQSVSHTGDFLKSIKSSLDGFEKYEKLSDNAFLKNSCGIWEIKMVFELVDQMIANKNTAAEITGVLDEYNLDLLINQYWYSNVNKEKYKLLNSDLSMYI